LQSFRIEQASRVIVDIQGGYRLSPGWRAALTVENLFDKRYYSTLRLPTEANWFGPPRSVVIRIDGRY
jgi:outer membrane receptor for ferric coprogen and ferric-rhodotorulic acid